MRSESFGANEGHHEIGAKRQGNGEAEDCFKHRSASQPLEKPRINGKKAEGTDANGKKDQIQHHHLLKIDWMLHLAPGLHQISIGKVDRPYKEMIKAKPPRSSMGAVWPKSSQRSARRWDKARTRGAGRQIALFSSGRQSTSLIC